MTDKSSQQQNNQQWDKLGEAIFNGIYKLLTIFFEGAKELFQYGYKTQVFYLLVFSLSNLLLVGTSIHLKLTNFLLADIVAFHLTDGIQGDGFAGHFLNLIIIEYIFLIFVFGIKSIRLKNKWKDFFESCGIKNGLDQTPLLIKTFKVDEFKTSYIFKSKGIGIDKYQSSKDAFQTLLEVPVHNIGYCKNPSFVKITTNSKELPSYLDYQEIKNSLHLNDYEFYLGDSLDGYKKENLVNLPHLFIAGTTGGGKSSFFKQTLMGLLESSDYLQMYLIDLKGGLEFSDFKEAKNTQIVKSIEDSVTTLEQINDEMQRRFNFLEKNGFKKINPKRDKLDRIVVAVDEASILYASRDKNSFDYDLVIQARELTDKISKLGRSAGIHLILATQKVSKETISTSIQENISARMSFRMNTLQGSLTVFGDKSANDLPSMSGRGIWKFGNDSFQVQAPYIEDIEIKERCKGLNKPLFSQMLGFGTSNTEKSKLSMALSKSEAKDE